MDAVAEEGVTAMDARVAGTTVSLAVATVVPARVHRGRHPRSGSDRRLCCSVTAEDGAPRQLLREFHECLEEGDRVVNKPVMGLGDYAAFVQMNDRFHSLIMRGCSNIALPRVMEMLDRQSFAPPSAMLPMQSSMEEGHQWMRIAHLSHHAMVQAIERGQGLERRPWERSAWR